MVTLIAKADTAPVQVDGFPKGCERSRKGAVHVRPGTVVVTDGEWAFIQKERPDLARVMRVVEPKKKPLVSRSVHAAPTVIPEPPKPKRERRRSGESIPDAD